MTLATLDKNIKSAVSFKGNMRFHMALNVRDIEASRAYYAKLFGKEPTKIRKGYAKWDLQDPSLNLALNQNKQVTDGTSGLSHFGVQVQSAELLHTHYQRLKDAGMVKYEEEQTACCYARQDKFWVEDPDGHRIEFFLVTEADVVENDPIHQGCCAEE